MNVDKLYMFWKVYGFSVTIQSLFYDRNASAIVIQYSTQYFCVESAYVNMQNQNKILYIHHKSAISNLIRHTWVNC